MRRTAVIVGALFWISNLSTLVGNVVAGPIPLAPNALTNMSPHATQIVIGTLIAHVNDAAIIGYAVLLFPVLRRFDDALALGYVAFKVVEATMLVVSGAVLLSLIALSQSYLAAGTSAGPYFQAVAEVTLAQQFWASRLAALAYLVATPILTFVLYRTRLVPRFISLWGFIALVMLAIGLAIGIGDPTRGFEPGQLLVIPIILWELFFATWLIVRGFTPTRA
jgi:uncharacterized protein DUF4386